MAWTGTVWRCAGWVGGRPALPVASCAAVFTRLQGSSGIPHGAGFRVGIVQDPVLSRQGTLSSATLARLARLARWQAAHTNTYWGTVDKQLSLEQRHSRGNSSAATLTLPPTGRLASATV